MVSVTPYRAPPTPTPHQINRQMKTAAASLACRADGRKDTHWMRSSVSCTRRAIGAASAAAPPARTRHWLRGGGGRRGWGGGGAEGMRMGLAGAAACGKQFPVPHSPGVSAGSPIPLFSFSAAIQPNPWSPTRSIRREQSIYRIPTPTPAPAPAPQRILVYLMTSC
jgi:hypothetical protein